MMFTAPRGLYLAGVSTATEAEGEDTRRTEDRGHPSSHRLWRVESHRVLGFSYIYADSDWVTSLGPGYCEGSHLHL